MPKVDVYLPDDLAAEVRVRQLPISGICRMALRNTLDHAAPDNAVRITEHVDTDLPSTPHLAFVMSLATAVAAEKGSHTVDSEHLLQALLDEEENLVLKGLDHLGLTRVSIQKMLDVVAPGRTSLNQSDVEFAPNARAVLRDAVADAHLVGDCVANGENLLWALVTEATGHAADILVQLGFFQVTTHQVLGLIEVGVVHADRHSSTGRAGILVEPAKITSRLERVESSLSSSCSQSDSTRSPLSSLVFQIGGALSWRTHSLDSMVTSSPTIPRICLSVPTS